MMEKLIGSAHRRPVMIGLYSGLRYGEIGAVRDGWLNTYSNDIEQVPCDVYNANHNDGLFHVRDATQLTAEEIYSFIKAKGYGSNLKNGIDCVLSTSACTDMSRSNKHVRPLSLTSYCMVDQLRLIEELKPATFIIENVDSYFDPANTLLRFEFETAKQSMVNYVIIQAVIDASEYGARQVRKRLIVFGVRKDLEVPPSFPDPEPIDYSKVSFQSLFPYLDGYASGQATKRYKTGPEVMFVTLTASDNSWAFENGERREFHLSERLKLVELDDGYDLSIVKTIKWEKRLTGNAFLPSLSQALFRHNRTNILYKSPTWK